MPEIDLALLERLAQQRRFEPRTLEIAKRLFLYKEPVKRLAAEYGVNVARIYAIRNQVRDAVEWGRLPEGWVEVTLAGPREIVEDLKRQLAEALRR